jgi:hypothetical protein
MHYLVSQIHIKFSYIVLNFLLDYTDSILKPSCKTVLFGFFVYPWEFSIIEVFKGLKWEYEKILISHVRF